MGYIPQISPSIWEILIPLVVSIIFAVIINIIHKKQLKNDFECFKKKKKNHKWPY